MFRISLSWGDCEGRQGADGSTCVQRDKCPALTSEEYVLQDEGRGGPASGPQSTQKGPTSSLVCNTKSPKLARHGGTNCTHGHSPWIVGVIGTATIEDQQGQLAKLIHLHTAKHLHGAMEAILEARILDGLFPG